MLDKPSFFSETMFDIGSGFEITNPKELKQKPERILKLKKEINDRLTPEMTTILAIAIASTEKIIKLQNNFEFAETHVTSIYNEELRTVIVSISELPNYYISFTDNRNALAGNTSQEQFDISFIDPKKESIEVLHVLRMGTTNEPLQATHLEWESIPKSESEVANYLKA